MSTNVEGQFVSPNDAKPNVRRGFLSAMWYYHKFFVKETPSFIGKLGQKWRVRNTWTTEIHEQYYPLTIGQKLRYPFVYVKFMWMCVKDWYYWRRSQNHA